MAPLPPDRRTVLPSIATTPTGTQVIAATQATKQLELLCVQGGEDITEVIV
jgi:hypothetical protein